jgi:hypothetical protein
VCGNDTRESNARREFLAAVLWSDVTLGQNRCTGNFVYSKWPIIQEKFPPLVSAELTATHLQSKVSLFILQLVS